MNFGIFNKNKEKTEEKALPKKEMFVDRLNTEVSKMNIKVGTYNKLLPLALSIINKHLDSFSKIEVELTYIHINLKLGAEVPALFCECESVGLMALLHSVGSYDYRYSSANDDHRWIKITLK